MGLRHVILFFLHLQAELAAFFGLFFTEAGRLYGASGDAVRFRFAAGDANCLSCDLDNLCDLYNRAANHKNHLNHGSDIFAGRAVCRMQGDTLRLLPKRPACACCHRTGFIRLLLTPTLFNPFFLQHTVNMFVKKKKNRPGSVTVVAVA